MAKTRYHVSSKDLGENPILSARIPGSAVKPEDLVTRRVCFCPTVKQCLYAITGHVKPNYGTIIRELLYGQGQVIENPTVYVTRKQLIVPESVSDYQITGEEWSLSDIKVKRKGYVNLMVLIIKCKVILTNELLSPLTKEQIKWLNFGFNCSGYRYLV